MKIRLLRKIKLVLLIIIFFGITGCSIYTPIKMTLYVTSLGFSYRENQYHVVAYIPNTTTISALDSTSEPKSESIEKEGKTIFELIYQLDQSTSIKTDLRFLKTVVFTKSFLEQKDALSQLLRIFLETNGLPLDVSFLYSKADLKEIYQTKIPDSTNISYDLFTFPETLTIFDPVIDIPYLGEIGELSSKKLPFILPMLDISSSWEAEEENKTCEIKGISYVQENQVLEFETDDFKELFLLKSHNNLFYQLDEQEFVFFEYKIRLKWKSDSLYFHVFIRYQPIVKGDLKEESIIREIQSILNCYKSNKIDLFGLNEFLYRKNKKLTNDTKFEFSVVLKKEETLISNTK